MLNQKDLPLGLAMALAQNTDAMEAFVHLTDREQTEVVEKAKHVSSKKEMRQIVSDLAHTMQR